MKPYRLRRRAWVALVKSLRWVRWKRDALVIWWSFLPVWRWWWRWLERRKPKASMFSRELTSEPGHCAWFIAGDRPKA